jgi:sulfur transfer complex TusBCD TusB component (DsrH family)
MKKLLHILKNSSDSNARAVIEALSRTHSSEMKVVLIQDGINLRPDWKAETYILKNELPLPDRLPSGIKVIDDAELVDLMFEADSVVCW